MFTNDVLWTTDKKRHNRANTNGFENNLSELSENIGTLETGIRVLQYERFQRFCLKCGKILPTKIKQNYVHICEKPDFLQ